MADYMTLLGAEQVSNAAHTMRSAADEMQRAAGNIQYAFDMHHRWMDDWLMQFQSALARLTPEGSAAKEKTE